MQSFDTNVKLLLSRNPKKIITMVEFRRIFDSAPKIFDTDKKERETM